MVSSMILIAGGSVTLLKFGKGRRAITMVANTPPAMGATNGHSTSNLNPAAAAPHAHELD
jgi:hypothetical protein